MTIPAFATSTTLTVNALNDSLIEIDETVKIKLISISSGDADINIGTGSGTTVTFEATDDTYVDSKAGSIVFGGASTVKVGQVTAPTDERHALIHVHQFLGKSGQSNPAGSKIVSAT